MAQSKKVKKKSSASAPKPTKSRRAKPAPKAIGLDEVKRMAKAPADYEETARQFATTQQTTGLRLTTSPGKVRALIGKGEKAAQKAEVARLRYVALDRTRIAAEPADYKAMLGNWRQVQALIPDRPDLADAFAFMTEWMSVQRDTAAAEPAATTTTG